MIADRGGKRRVAEKGVWQDRVPFGYVTEENRRLVLGNPAEIALVRRIFDGENGCIPKIRPPQFAVLSQLIAARFARRPGDAACPGVGWRVRFRQFL